MEELKALYNEYIDWAEKLYSSANPIYSVLGMRSAEVNHPGHMNFYNAVKQWTEKFMEEPHDVQMIEQALDVILFSAAENEKSAAVWYLIAAQEHAKQLLDALPLDRRQDFGKKYVKIYPRGKRLPVQNELYSLMK